MKRTMGLSLAQKLAVYSRRDPLTGCLNWIGSKNNAGRGQLYWDGKVQRTHRLAYQLIHGSVPKGMCVLHHCDNIACIEEKHLFVGTQTDNMADMVGKNRQLRGEQRPSAKLNNKKVSVIRRGVLSDEMFAVKYGVHPRTVKKARLGITWSHVP